MDRPADQRAAVQAALGVERAWLQSWFEGTPVAIAQRPDGAVSVEVPREFCFEPGRDKVKPALAAVLDKVAESLRRRSPTRLALLAAPGDTADEAPLAKRRALQVRHHLLARGVPAARIDKSTTTATAAVQLRIEIDLP
jgi:outer membrane protein OmpA-like peptidoglycan-associated protein